MKPDGLEGIVTHAHRTLDLLDNVTDVQPDGLETTVIYVTPNLDPRDNATLASWVGLDQSVMRVRDSASAPKVTVLNVSRTATGRKHS